jgi:hypothetical protein
MKQLDNILDTAHQNPTSSNGQIVSYDQVAFIPSARNDLRLRGQDGKPHRPLGEGEQFSPGFADEVFIGSIAELLSSEFAPA